MLNKMLNRMLNRLSRAFNSFHAKKLQTLNTRKFTLHLSPNEAHNRMHNASD